MVINVNNDLWNQRYNVSLDSLYLDPNNYRFIDKEHYIQVPETDVHKFSIQQRTKNFIVEKNNEGIDDLLRSFKKNGYLDVDQIQVRKISDNVFLVIEGNRRVTALKVLKGQYDSHIDIGALNPEVFENVPVVVTDGVDDNHYKILMGLKHISGNKKWPAVNQAKLLKSLKVGGMSDGDLVNALGISKMQLNRYLRALALIAQYEASEYGDQFRTDMFNLFSETIRQPKMMSWLGWDNNTNTATNSRNLARLFSWFSFEEVQIEEEEGEDSFRTETLEPIVSKGTDLRDLVNFIDDETALERMEHSRSIAQAYLSSDRISADKFENAIEIIDKQLTTAIDFSRYSSNSTKERLPDLRKKFDALLITKGVTEVLQNRAIQREVLVNFENNNFEKITIQQFKKLKNITIDKLNRVNIFAGENNTGKSTLLEAIYSLTKMNDIYGFNDLQRRRGKFANRMPALFLQRSFNQDIDISGIYYHKEIKISIQKEQDESNELDKADYLSSIIINASFANEAFSSQMQIFESQEPKVYFSRMSNLCNCRYSSPFSANDIDETLLAHSKSIDENAHDEIISFIQKNVDNAIESITLTNDKGLERFKAKHSNLREAIDLTQFGDGVQRIYNIALQFAACKNGILLIDEIENAIHHSLFKQFTNLIFDLANRFKVQVFVTSHSEECINAFFEDESKAHLISAYRLANKNNEIVALYEEGERYRRLINNFGADLRG